MPPGELLQALNVYVVGALTENLADEVIVLGQHCRGPYLEKEIDDKNAKLVAGVKNHYEGVCAIAEQKQARPTGMCPSWPWGICLRPGGEVDGDGVRELYVGSLRDVFPRLLTIWPWSCGSAASHACVTAVRRFPWAMAKPPSKKRSSWEFRDFQAEQPRPRRRTFKTRALLSKTGADRP